MINSFIRRLNSIGITIELIGNYPWVYLTRVNGAKVTEKFQARHGFTAFMLLQDGSFKITDRAEVFKILRKYYLKDK